MEPKYRLRFCVWEITLQCNARCRHCGSSAGSCREDELQTDEALDLVGQLAALGCEKVTLSGGEPLLRRDWPELAQAIVDAGMDAEMISNGLAAQEQANVIARAGLFAVTFSIDGTGKVHDELRQVPGGLNRALGAARELASRGVLMGAVTQVNRLNLGCLEEIHELLVANSFSGWQVQLTMPLGRAADQGDELCLAPDQLPELESMLVSLSARSPLFLEAADNFGYMSRSEPILRDGTRKAQKFFSGCQAGQSVIGITSNGTVRGCLSHPAALDQGNIRQRPLAEIWNDPQAFAYNRCFDPRKDLSGHCAACALAKICRAGCKSMAYAATGALSENPYCLLCFARPRAEAGSR